MTVDYGDKKDESKTRFTLTNRKNPSEKKEVPWFIGTAKDWGAKGFWNKCGGKEDWHNDKSTWRRKVFCQFPNTWLEAMYDTHSPTPYEMDRLGKWTPGDPNSRLDYQYVPTLVKCRYHGGAEKMETSLTKIRIAPGPTDKV
jgi:hypothetical protein